MDRLTDGWPVGHMDGRSVGLTDRLRHSQYPIAFFNQRTNDPKPLM